MKSSNCPKSMTYGPCGGVGQDGSCEVGELACPFVELVTMSWAHPSSTPRDVAVPRVVVDHRPTGDAGLDQEILSGYRELGVAVLLGEHLDDPPGIDRLETARRTAASGAATIATITGRSGTRLARTELISRLVEAGVSAVLCVTGDHPAARFPGRPPVAFYSEGTELAHEARGCGAVVAVAESPASPPRTRRAHRLLAKQDAGADYAILNHAGSVAETRRFANDANVKGLRLPLIAAVPVMTDRRSITALAQFPGVALPSGAVSTIQSSTDPVRAGVEVAVGIARGMLRDGLFAGVNLSGVATGAGPRERSRIMRLVASELVRAGDSPRFRE